MKNVFLVGAFGFIGVIFRYLIAKNIDTEFPFSTFLINVFGSFLIGFIYAYDVEKNVISIENRTIIMVGLLGGFTTFSSYSLDTLKLFENGNLLQGISYAVASPIFGLLATAVGILLAKCL